MPLLTGNFHHQITVQHSTFFGEFFVRSKMAITLELKPCVSNYSTGIEKQSGYQGTNIELSRVQLIYF